MIHPASLAEVLAYAAPVAGMAFARRQGERMNRRGIGHLGGSVFPVNALRDVATRTAIGSAHFANVLPYNNWKGQVARSPISAIQVAWCNWAIVSGTEVPSGGNATMRAAVEFPLSGTITQLTWNAGAASITVADGLEAVTDMVTLPRTIPVMLGSPSLTFSSAAHTITRDTGSWLADGFAVGDTVAVDGCPSGDATAGGNNGPAGAIAGLTASTMTFAAGLVNEATVVATVAGHFRLRHWYQGAVGLSYTQVGPFQNAAMGDAARQDATDFTMQAAMADDFGGVFIWPARIMAFTSIANDLCLFEDSRGVGSGEATPNVGGCGNQGQSARSLAPRHAIFRLMQAGGGAYHWVTAGHVRQSRLAALAPPSSVLICVGINDLTVVTAATTIANIATVASSFPITTKVYVGTVAPKTTSSDSWATTVNQTPTGIEAQRVALNTMIRALTTATVPNFAGVVEIANSQETAQDSGIWKVTGGTGQAAFSVDGLHASTIGDKLVSISIT